MPNRSPDLEACTGTLVEITPAQHMKEHYVLLRSLSLLLLSNIGWALGTIIPGGGWEGSNRLTEDARE